MPGIVPVNNYADHCQDLVEYVAVLLWAWSALISLTNATCPADQNQCNWQFPYKDLGLLQMVFSQSVDHILTETQE